MAVSEKQKAYAKKYLKKLDEIKVRVPEGTKDRWKQAAADRDKSLNQLIVDAVEQEIKGDWFQRPAQKQDANFIKFVNMKVSKNGIELYLKDKQADYQPSIIHILKNKSTYKPDVVYKWLENKGV